MGSDWGDFKTPCPNCSGTVEHYSFDDDCRGNAGSSGICCKGCKRQFTLAEWNLIAQEEMAERARKKVLLQCGFDLKYIREKLHSSPDELKELEGLLFKGEEPTEGDHFDPSLHKLLLQYAKDYAHVVQSVPSASTS